MFGTTDSAAIVEAVDRFCRYAALVACGPALLGIDAIQVPSVPRPEPCAFAPRPAGNHQAVWTAHVPGETVMSEQDFTITREFAAPRELVFKAWTDFTTSHCAIDARPGGRWLSAMRSPEGHDFWSSGVFVELDAPARFVIDEGFSDEEGNRLTAQDYGMTDDMPSEDRVTVCETFDKLDSYLTELQRGTELAH